MTQSANNSPVTTKDFSEPYFTTPHKLHTLKFHRDCVHGCDEIRGSNAL